MLENYFKIAIRNLLRHKAYSFINIIGLAIGLTSFILIASFLVDELGYDRYPEHSRNIYRVGLQISQNGGLDDYPNVDVAVGPGIKNAFPEVAASTRITGAFGDYVQYGDVQFQETVMAYADSNFLEMFSIPLLNGNADKALTEPNSVVISKALEKKYFGTRSALGESLNFRERGLMKVTGVFDKIPDNTHFHFDAFISMTSHTFFMTRNTWSNIGFYTYLLLNEHADPKQLESKFPDLIKKYVAPEAGRDMGISGAEAEAALLKSWTFYLMPLADIHLHSNTKYEIEANGDINNIYIFGALAFFILLLACINFTNLATASSAKRAMEIGIRKALGSLQKQLVNQFLMESILLSVSALLIALLLSVTMLPLFNQLTGKHIQSAFLFTPLNLGILLALGIAVGVLAGIYPAFFLSSFKTLRILKGNLSHGSSKRSGLRGALVVFQFALSTALIVATLVVHRQLHYMQTMKLGYDKEQVLVIDDAVSLGKNQEAFKQQLLKDHRVTHASLSSSPPVGNISSFGGTEVLGKETNAGTTHVSIFAIDTDYLQTLGMKIVTGRNFSLDFPGDSSGVIINETAMRDLGWNENNVLGGVITRSGRKRFEIVGVVEDFHFTSARQKIAPVMMLYSPHASALLVKAKTADMPEFIAALKKQWTSFNTGTPIEYSFLDDRFERMYHAEQITEQIFTVFMVIAIIIACLGLYGLSAYSAEQRIKEIGIRKVLGSSVQQVVILQTQEFLRLVLIAIIISTPVAWWTMHQWLQNFGYHIDINAGIIIIAALLAIGIALITVSFQSVKAAIANPIKSLRSE